jgi:type II secretory pathway pseudopilin PulG
MRMLLLAKEADRMKRSNGFAFIGLLLSVVILALLYSVFLKTLGGDEKAAVRHTQDSIASADVNSGAGLANALEDLKKADKDWKKTEKKIDQLSK